ncbi:hypothetical protein BDV96DRAFT_601704 [Lophiotrema nucula]|uniref:Uncharacterized protein n=1 Tax=Lophiotrema nucula TaxID=690887 RepID=A0A6A5Z1I7_9PLEO|nr:hypothetical protein BDV96DRAFT_601704 [Lophiotrema nucula]
MSLDISAKVTSFHYVASSVGLDVAGSSEGACVGFTCTSANVAGARVGPSPLAAFRHPNALRANMTNPKRTSTPTVTPMPSPTFAPIDSPLFLAPGSCKLVGTDAARLVVEDVVVVENDACVERVREELVAEDDETVVDTACPLNVCGNSTTLKLFVQQESSTPQHHLVEFPLPVQGVILVPPPEFLVSRQTSKHMPLVIFSAHELIHHNVVSTPVNIFAARFWQRPLGRHSSLVSPSIAYPPGGLSRLRAQQMAFTGSTLHGAISVGSGTAVPLAK